MGKQVEVQQKKEKKFIVNFPKSDDIEYEVFTLNTVSEWIKNADQKASIILGIVGILFSIIFTTDIGESIFNKIIVFSNSCKVYEVLIFYFFILTVSIIIFGLVNLVQVLVPKLKSKNYSGSLLFFGDIAKQKNYSDFELKLSKISKNEIVNDFRQQLFINSSICMKKFSSLRTGLIACLYGFIALIVLGIIIGLL